jgi:malate dehydrogenase
MKKVSVIGSGNVGATAVYYIAEKNIADIVMVDVDGEMARKKALDFRHSAALRSYNVSITGTNDYAAISGSDVAVIAAGVPRKPGMDRMDLLKTNASIVKDVARKIAAYCPDAVVIVVTNPLDVMAYLTLVETGFALKKVMGMAGALDSTRFRYFIAEKLNVWPGDVSAMVLGGHGDEMAPLKNYTSAGGIPIPALLDDTAIEQMIQRTRDGGGEIVKYLKAGSAFYAPGAAVSMMVEAVIKNEKRIVAVSAYQRGEYGYQDIFLGVPVLLGKNGVERIIRIELSDEEKKALDKSANAVRDGIDMLKSFYSPGMQ